MKKVVYAVVIVALVVGLAGCANFFASLEPKLITISGTEFTLEWDPPKARLIEEGHEPDHYNVYYRGFGETGPADWTVLGSVGALAPLEITVTLDMIPVGTYLFAVSTVDGFGLESDLHQSIDPYADPRRGWILELTGG